MTTRLKVAMDKMKHPERYCPSAGCLWKTATLNRITGQREGAAFCPRRHVRHAPPKSSALECIRNGFVFPGKPTPGEGRVR
jgi:hypothetical protein